LLEDKAIAKLKAVFHSGGRGSRRAEPDTQHTNRRLSRSFAIPKHNSGVLLGRARLPPRRNRHPTHKQAAQQELRHPKTQQRRTTREGEAPAEPKQTPNTQTGGSAGASPSQNTPAEFYSGGRGSCRAEPDNQRTNRRLSRSFALPKDWGWA
jgi:hypothetical protein